MGVNAAQGYSTLVGNTTTLNELVRTSMSKSAQFGDATRQQDTPRDVCQTAYLFLYKLTSPPLATNTDIARKPLKGISPAILSTEEKHSFHTYAVRADVRSIVIVQVLQVF
jgi:hypothetical protein